MKSSDKNMIYTLWFVRTYMSKKKLRIYDLHVPYLCSVLISLMMPIFSLSLFHSVRRFCVSTNIFKHTFGIIVVVIISFTISRIQLRIWSSTFAECTHVCVLLGICWIVLPSNLFEAWDITSLTTKHLF